MDKLKLNTGNCYADSMLERRLADAPEFWALVDYLEVKGAIDRVDFLDFLSRRCTDYVKLVNRVHQETDD